MAMQIVANFGGMVGAAIKVRKDVFFGGYGHANVSYRTVTAGEGKINWEAGDVSRRRSADALYTQTPVARSQKGGAATSFNCPPHARRRRIIRPTTPSPSTPSDAGSGTPPPLPGGGLYGGPITVGLLVIVMLLANRPPVNILSWMVAAPLTSKNVPSISLEPPPVTVILPPRMLKRM